MTDWNPLEKTPTVETVRVFGVDLKRGDRVVLDDDPGRDLGALRQPGHRFFFSPEEVVPLALDDPSSETSP
jgi:hypothetical protein